MGIYLGEEEHMVCRKEEYEHITNITGNLHVYGDIFAVGNINSNSSNTITHYCPIEAGENIDDYIVGKPVFMSGHVYKYNSKKKYIY